MVRESAVCGRGGQVVTVVAIADVFEEEVIAAAK